MLISEDKNRIYLGIDGGGSKCKAVIMNADFQVLGEGLAGGANPLHGFEKAQTAIVDSAQQALDNSGLKGYQLADLIAGVGLAGVNVPKFKELMLSWTHPFQQLFLTTDLHIACLGAHQGEDGAVIVTGTGSCGFAIVKGREYSIGGYGFPHGDKGSGAWLGYQGVKYVLESMDGLVVNTSMTDPILSQFGCNNPIDLVSVVAGQQAGFFAKLASIVFESAANGDELATKIVKEGAQYISQMARRLFEHKPPYLSMIGGISPLLCSWLDDDVIELITEAKRPPEQGAVLFAEQQMYQLQTSKMTVNQE